MKSSHAIGLIVAIWSLIYLSYLGERELRGEEIRRIIPAQEMIENDQWIVPTIAGEVYGNKPPLINWIIAGSFMLTGSQSEWAARIPCVLFFLALSLVTFLTLRTEFGVKKAVSVPLVLMTAGSMIEKCRLAEIEPVFIALFGFACLSWISLWTAKKSPWLIWTVPYIFVGLGCLAKGPVHLLFWIFFLVCILKGTRSVRDIFHWGHLLGLLIMLGISLPWVFANLAAVDQPSDTVDNWMHEIRIRADFSSEKLKEWAFHPFEIPIRYLPWSVPLCFSLWCLRKRPKPVFPLSRWDAVKRGCFWCSMLSALALLSIPGGLPRYLLPLYVPVSIAVVSLYFEVGKKHRDGYERFVYFSLIAACIVFLGVAVSVTVAACLKELSPLWPQLVAAIALTLCFLVWLIKRKTEPGVFISVPLFIACGYLVAVTAILPFQRMQQKFRYGASVIRAIAPQEGGTSVFYADSEFREFSPKHLRLLYYLGDDFVGQGESKSLPNGTRFVIGRESSVHLIKDFKTSFKVVKKELLEIEGLSLEAFHLEPAGT